MPESITAILHTIATPTRNNAVIMCMLVPGGVVTAI